MNKEESFFLDCETGMVVISGRKVNYLKHKLKKGQNVNLLLDLKQGTIEFQIDDIFCGVAIKHKSLKKGTFYTSVIINDKIKSGSSVQIIPYIDENQRKIDEELKRLNDQEAEFQRYVVQFK